MKEENKNEADESSGDDDLDEAINNINIEEDEEGIGGSAIK